MILLGVTIKAGMNVDMYGVSAWLVFSRIKFLPCFMICKDHHCKPEEGPTLKFELKTLPPSFKLEASVFANVFGFKFGVIILIQWTSVYRLKVVQQHEFPFWFVLIVLCRQTSRFTPSNWRGVRSR